MHELRRAEQRYTPVQKRVRTVRAFFTASDTISQSVPIEGKWHIENSEVRCMHVSAEETEEKEECALLGFRVLGERTIHPGCSNNKDDDYINNSQVGRKLL